MDIREYIVNPMGRGDSSIPNRQLLLSSLDDKFVRLTTNKDIDMKIYHDVLGGDYYFHLIIPTETERTNTYDVVFRFYDKDKSHRKDLSISQYDVQVFANSPSFAYTFAYVYNKNGLAIKDLLPKLGKDFINIKPEVRNRYEIINYEKYIYFAARYILDSKKMNRIVLETIAKPFNSLTRPGISALGTRIRSLDQVLKEYHNAEAELRRKKKVIKEKQNHPTNTGVKTIKSSTGSSSSVSVVKPVRKSHGTGGISKTSKTIKKLNKR